MNNLIAHRGVNNLDFGENTKEAVVDSLKNDYVKGVEIDARITKDNKIVVIHDMTINRTSNGTGFVNRMSLKELKKYNFGTDKKFSRINTLREILRVIDKDKIVLIEIKHDGGDDDRYIKYFYRSIKPFLNKNIYIMSFDGKIIKKLKEKYPFLKCGVLISSIINASFIDDNMDFVAISSYSVKKVKNINKPIFVWGINSKKRYFELLEKMSLDTYYIVDVPRNYLSVKKKNNS
ncbi:MAG: glycerophosphodiester phosphodiesterase [Bacilli bacterium]